MTKFFDSTNLKHIILLILSCFIAEPKLGFGFGFGFGSFAKLTNIKCKQVFFPSWLNSFIAYW